MAKKLLVTLQTPVIELEVVAKDAAGVSDKIIIGFKRYTAKEIVSLMQEENALPDSFKQYESTDKIPNNVLLQEMEFLTNRSENTLARIRNDILYIKNAKVKVYDEIDGELVEIETIKIEDTRKATPNSFWGDAKECLSVLVDHYFDSSPWKDAIQKANQLAIQNVPEAKVKN